MTVKFTSVIIPTDILSSEREGWNAKTSFFIPRINRSRSSIQWDASSFIAHAYQMSFNPARSPKLCKFLCPLYSKKQTTKKETRVMSLEQSLSNQNKFRNSKKKNLHSYRLAEYWPRGLEMHQIRDSVNPTLTPLISWQCLWAENSRTQVRMNTTVVPTLVAWKQSQAFRQIGALQPVQSKCVRHF